MSKNRNPFLPFKGKEFNRKRNSFDLSRQNLFTTDWGKIYPFFIEEVIPGDSFEIDASIGFRAMQTKFPLQTRIRTSASFYLVRNRTLWNGFEDWIYKTKGASDGVVAPFLKISNINSSNANVLRTGSLGDALGVPSTVGSSNSSSKIGGIRSFFAILAAETQSSWSNTILKNYLDSKVGYDVPRFIIPLNGSYPPANVYGFMNFINIPMDFSSLVSVTFFYNVSSTTTTNMYFLIFWGNATSLQYEAATLLYVEQVTVSLNSTSLSATFNISSTIQEKIEFYRSHGIIMTFGLAGVSSSGGAPALQRSSDSYSVSYVSPDIAVPNSSPFVGNTPSLPINALPFRAYEMVMNYYFRNDINNPYYIDGVPQYNKFIPSDDGGGDTNVYDFHFHNWELDRFVSALPSPQFGAAPLVGLTYNVGAEFDKATLSFDSGDPDNPYKANVAIDPESGEVAQIVNFSEGLPSSNLRQLAEMVNAGFSINTLRDVNSFQRFLENCQRRGLRYRNQLKSHTGVDVDYPDIDVPQYIGGFSDWAQVGQVTNMAELADTGLGDYVGTLSGLSKSKRKIRCYCPEHGFIIGVYSIYPVPIYSQSISKFLLKTNPFDYYQEEFAKIGFTPIHYSELCPLQTDENHSLSDVFGYQKAWYEYMSSYDSCHGDFRTSLRDFVVQRLFDSAPDLSESFVRVNPTPLNDIFLTRNIADAYGSNSKFLCSAVTNVTALRQIPIRGIPSLE